MSIFDRIDCRICARGGTGEPVRRYYRGVDIKAGWEVQAAEGGCVELFGIPLDMAKAVYAHPTCAAKSPAFEGEGGLWTSGNGSIPVPQGGRVVRIF